MGLASNAGAREDKVKQTAPSRPSHSSHAQHSFPAGARLEMPLAKSSRNATATARARDFRFPERRGEDEGFSWQGHQRRRESSSAYGIMCNI